MKRYWAVVGALVTVFLVLFVAFEALGVPLLTDPLPFLRRGGAAAGLAGVALLATDVLLPVPSSVVMVAHGALYGVALGTLLSLVGSVGAALLAFALGRRGGPLLDRLVPPSARSRSEAVLRRWGPLAIVVTRPVPLLAETVAVLAGASSLRWRQLILAATLGALPFNLMYAWAGATASGLGTGWVALVLASTAAVFWLVSHWLGWRSPEEGSEVR
ncbi:VTT domain-containing protein [Deinococcus budaensis]|uniref:Putative membrane protein YdjX (TVP38/TMEM64 family) n=1 Tax=Deinococcus budaensis TaxID=1665626 RepID=A0A7W8LQ54_9DEIO|nr:putative membrane protein YdjX (TVP38/TMEM64 family) [Deinococcus budaensis]